MIGKPHAASRLLVLLLALGALMQGCEQKATSPHVAGADEAFTPIELRHQLGSTRIEQPPRTVVALDMNEVDFLDQLDVAVAGMPKDFVPHFLARYKNSPQVEDAGAIVQPNLERVYRARPDLILITSLQAAHYAELSEMAPTLHFDVDYRDSEIRHIEVIRQHLLDLGQIFSKQSLAERKAAELDARVAQARETISTRPERALVVMHNNGAFTIFGRHSRYGFIFDGLGVKPASEQVESGLHGQPISSEFIQQSNPDILYVVDRTAVMEGRPVLDAERMSNPLLRQTNAWKNQRVVFVDPEAWYVTAASPTSLALIIDDVLKGYQP